MATRPISPQDHERIADAIRAAESKTDGEIYCVVAHASDGYFFPAAFTTGCTLEAHEFAEATDDFAKLGATVVGMTAGNIDKIDAFSAQECRNKFAVGVATPTMIDKYDVKLALKPGWTNRTSYVIAPDGKILLAYTAMGASGHVTNTMDAVKAWKAKH